MDPCGEFGRTPRLWKSRESSLTYQRRSILSFILWRSSFIPRALCLYCGVPRMLMFHARMEQYPSKWNSYANSTVATTHCFD